MKKKILAVLMAVVCLVGSISVPQKAKASEGSGNSSVQDILPDTEVVESITSLVWEQGKSFSPNEKIWKDNEKRASHEGQILKLKKGNVIEFNQTAKDNGWCMYVSRIEENGTIAGGVLNWGTSYTVQNDEEYLIINIGFNSGGNIAWPTNLKAEDLSDYLKLRETVTGITEPVEVVTSIADLKWEKSSFNGSAWDKTSTTRASHVGQVLKIEKGDKLTVKQGKELQFYYYYYDGSTNAKQGNWYSNHEFEEEGIQYIVLAVRNNSTDKNLNGVNVENLSDYFTLTRATCEFGHKALASDWTYDENEHWKECTACSQTVERENHSDNNSDGACDTCGYRKGYVQIPGIEGPLEEVTSLTSLVWKQGKSFSPSDKIWKVNEKRASHEGQILKLKKGNVIEFNQTAKDNGWFMYVSKIDKGGTITSGVLNWGTSYTVQNDEEYLIINIGFNSGGSAAWPTNLKAEDLTGYLRLRNKTVTGITEQVEEVTSLADLEWAEDTNFTVDKAWYAKDYRASHTSQVLKVEPGDEITFKDSSQKLYFYLYLYTQDGFKAEGNWLQSYTVGAGIEYLVIVVGYTSGGNSQWPDTFNEKNTSDYLTITRKSCNIEHSDNNGDGKCDTCGYKEGSVQITGINGWVEVVNDPADLKWEVGQTLNKDDKKWNSSETRVSHPWQVLEVKEGYSLEVAEDCDVEFYYWCITETDQQFKSNQFPGAWLKAGYRVSFGDSAGEAGIKYIVLQVRNSSNNLVGFDVNTLSSYLSIVDGTSITMQSAQVEITDSLALNLDVKVPNDATPYISIDGPGEDVVLGSMTKTGDVWTYQYSDIRAQEMNDSIKITVTTGEDVYRIFTYSIMKYCKNLLAMEDEEFAGYTADQIAAIRELVVDLVQYGAALQTYRGEDDVLSSQIGDKISYDLNNNVTSLANLTAVTPLNENQSDSYKWTGVTLVLKEKVNIRAKFSAENIEGLTVHVAVGKNASVNAEIVSAGNNQYYVYFDGICANQYDETITFTFMKGGEEVGATLNYSVNTYLKVASEHDSTRNNANLIALLNAINEYGQAAKNVANNG